MFGIAGISLVSLSVYLRQINNKHKYIPEVLNNHKLKFAGMIDVLNQSNR